MNKRTCIQDGCANTEVMGGYRKCWGHYAEEILAPRPIIAMAGTRKRLINSYWMDVVRYTEGCWEWEGAVTAKGYPRLSFRGRDAPAHRVSYEIANGPIPEGMFIDHLCHNPECTNPEHLRAVTPQQNSQHRAGKNPNNTSGRHGVHWSKSARKWIATVHAGDDIHYLGGFDDLDEAAEAARLKRNELFTHNDKDRRAA